MIRDGHRNDWMNIPVCFTSEHILNLLWSGLKCDSKFTLRPGHFFYGGFNCMILFWFFSLFFTLFDTSPMLFGFVNLIPIYRIYCFLRELNRLFFIFVVNYFPFLFFPSNCYFLYEIFNSVSSFHACTVFLLFILECSRVLQLMTIWEHYMILLWLHQNLLTSICTRDSTEF